MSPVVLLIDRNALCICFFCVLYCYSHPFAISAAGCYVQPRRIGVAQMTLGEKAVLRITSDYAYGSRVSTATLLVWTHLTNFTRRELAVLFLQMQTWSSRSSYSVSIKVRSSNGLLDQGGAEQYLLPLLQCLKIYDQFILLFVTTLLEIRRYYLCELTCEWLLLTISGLFRVSTRPDYQIMSSHPIKVTPAHKQ